MTLLVGPGGSGKTLGIAGWLRRSGRAADTTWVSADATWDAERLLTQLARRTDDEPALVVVDDAHRLPLATIQALDAPPRHRARRRSGCCSPRAGTCRSPGSPRSCSAT